jgi:hypothetical protein
VKDGDVIEQDDTPEGAVHFVGFKPGRAGKREGWLVYLVHTNPATKTDTRFGHLGQQLIVKVGKKVGVHKRHAA